MLLTTCLVKSGATDIMNVKIEMSIINNVIVILHSISTVTLVQSLNTFEMASFSDAYK